MDEQGFHGHDWQRSPRVILLNEGERKTVFLNGNPYMSWTAEDTLSPRLAIVQLYRTGMGTQEELAQVFGLHEKTVYNYVQAFDFHGAHGLVSQKSGPKGSWKINATIRGKILVIALAQGILEYEEIKRRLEAWGEEVSIPTIREVLLENGIHEKLGIPKTGGNQRELFDPQSGGLLCFTFNENKECEHPIVAGETAHREDDRQRDSEARLSGEEARDRSFYSQGQRGYLNRLERGEYNAYAGGLLFAPLLEKYSYLPTLKRVLVGGMYEGYSFEELCLTLLYLDVFGFRSMEDFKRAYAEEFGVLIGRSCSPSHFTLRRFLHKVRKRGKSEELIEEFAYEYLKEGIARWGVMYIDGHFLPYYGMYPITKGWHSVRKIPMKGSYHFIGVDESFTPWIFLIRSSAEDLLQKIPEILEKAKVIAKRAGLDEQRIEDMVVIFDREGYSGELYRYLDGRDRQEGKRRALFISWSKYSQWIYDIAESELDRSVVVQYAIQKDKQFKYHQTEHIMSKYGKIRTIVVQREPDKKRAAIYTNGTEEELEAERVVQLICRRWGEENLIKTLMGRHFIDYTPGYVTEQMEQQPMVDNPAVEQLRRKKAILKTELHKLKVSFADKILKEPRGEMNWQEIQKNETPLLTEMIKCENDISSIGQEIDKLPSKIPFNQAHGGEHLLMLNYEKKRFLDCIKVFSYNMQRKMCEHLLKYYPVEKDILPALSMIVSRGGSIKLEGENLSVRLKGFRNPAIDYAARHLCEDLNRMHPKTPDKFRHMIHFEVV